LSIGNTTQSSILAPVEVGTPTNCAGPSRVYIRSGYEPGRWHKKNGNRARAQRKPSARFAIAEPAELLISMLEGCVRQQDPHESGLRDIEKGYRENRAQCGRHLQG
jgi:hypothetical protein